MANLNREYVFEIQDFKTYIYVRNTSSGWQWGAWEIDNKSIKHLFLSPHLSDFNQVLFMILGKEENVAPAYWTLKSIRNIIPNNQVINLELILETEIGVYKHQGFAIANPELLNLLIYLYSQEVIKSNTLLVNKVNSLPFKGKVV